MDYIKGQTDQKRETNLVTETKMEERLNNSKKKKQKKTIVIKE